MSNDIEQQIIKHFAFWHSLKPIDWQIGDWYCFDVQDALLQIENEKDLRHLHDEYKEFAENGDTHLPMVWKTKEEALKNRKGK